MTVTVFSTGPKCFRCKTVKMHLDKRKIQYVEVDLNENIDQAIALRKQVNPSTGKTFNLAPVVRAEINGTISWSEGYVPDFLDGLQAALV